MHTIYRELPYQEIKRILDYCRANTVQNGGLFEVYTTPGEDLHLIVVNSCPEGGDPKMFRPLGGFYCNYMGPGVISIEDEDLHFDGVASRKRHVAAVKQVIDILIEQGFPDTKISFNDLPALKNFS